MKILKSKFSLIILITLVLLNVVFINLSSAFSISYENKKYDFGDVPLLNYTYILKSVNSDGSVSVISIYSLENELVFYGQMARYSGKGYLHTYYASSNTVNVGSILEYSNVSNFISLSSLNDKCIYSNFDMLDSSGNVVFRRPALTLGEVLEITNPVQTYQTMIHGMIISLILFLVGLVAFWKAWQLLSKELHKA